MAAMPSIVPRTRARRLAVVPLGLWAVALGFVVFSPTSDRPSSVVAKWDHFMLFLGVPHDFATFTLWQVLFNIFMFVPVGALGPLVIGIRHWAAWLAIGLSCGGFIELTQAVFLPDRDAQVSDVIANGSGVLLGFLLLSGATAMINGARTPTG